MGIKSSKKVDYYELDYYKKGKKVDDSLAVIHTKQLSIKHLGLQRTYL